MDLQLKQAIRRLTGETTCVLLREDKIYESRERGVRPLLDLLDSGAATAGGVAADRVVGRGAAFLYCLMGIRSLYAGVVSRAAMEVLEAAGITVTYGVLTDRIQNRTKDGLCPIESATMDCRTPEQALRTIRDTLSRL